MEVAKLIDISKCIGCKACQVACMEWNDLRDTVGKNAGVYDNPADLTDQSWTVMRFSEVEVTPGRLEWLIRKDGCMHCADPGCLKACPAPGAIIQYSNGIVDFHEENCIGCGYCIIGCPFNIPRLSKRTARSTSARSVPTGWRWAWNRPAPRPVPPGRSSSVPRRTCSTMPRNASPTSRNGAIRQAGLYNPSGVGGTHVMYVLQHADQPGLYHGLPKDPGISPAVALWKGIAKTVMNIGLGAAILAGIFHYVTQGPNEVREEEEEQQ